MCNHGKVKGRLRRRSYNQETKLKTSYNIENRIEYKGGNSAFSRESAFHDDRLGRMAVTFSIKKLVATLSSLFLPWKKLGIQTFYFRLPRVESGFAKKLGHEKKKGEANAILLESSLPFSQGKGPSPYPTQIFLSKPETPAVHINPQHSLQALYQPQAQLRTNMGNAADT
ncbi:hypothetical protein CR513_02666, partial [Mucuna pruriens]